MKIWNGHWSTATVQMDLEHIEPSNSGGKCARAKTKAKRLRIALVHAGEIPALVQPRKRNRMNRSVARTTCSLQEQCELHLGSMSHTPCMSNSYGTFPTFLLCLAGGLLECSEQVRPSQQCCAGARPLYQVAPGSTHTGRLRGAKLCEQWAAVRN